MNEIDRAGVILGAQLISFLVGCGMAWYEPIPTKLGGVILVVSAFVAFCRFNKVQDFLTQKEEEIKRLKHTIYQMELSERERVKREERLQKSKAINNP